MSTASLRRALKRTALQALRSGGVYSRSANSHRRRQELLILCYHGVSLRDEHEWAGHLFVSPQRFQRRLAALRELKASVLPLAEGLKRLKSGSLPPRAVVITFDDGFVDFVGQAVPLLREFQLPSTLYLTTYYSGRPMPVVNLAIDYLLWKSGEKKAAFPEQGIANELPLTGWAERMEAVRRLMEWCERQRLDTKAKDDFARSIAQRFHLDYDELLRSRMLQIMRPDELAQAARMGVDIQLHTHRHRTPLNRELFLEEIKLNRERINDITGKSPTHFCYPSGQYDRDFFPWLEECGIESATTCVRGFADPTSDPYLVPRVLDDSNMSELEFEGVVSGLLA